MLESKLVIVRVAAHRAGYEGAAQAVGQHLGKSVDEVAEMLSDRLSRALIARAMGGDTHDYQL